MATEYEEEVKNLFDQVTQSINGTLDHHRIRAISFDNFKQAIDKMMNTAYHYGKMDGMKEANDIIDNVLS